MTPSINQSTSTPAWMPWFAILGGLVLVAGAQFAPDRVWANLLVITFYLVTLGLGGTVFIALAYVCGASWNVAFRRVPEALAGMLPVTCFALLGVLAVRYGSYAWHAHGEHDPGTFWFKEAWSNPSFWAARAVVYVLLWVFLSWAIVAVSRRQDATRNLRLTLLNTRLSALFLGIYAVTFSLASADWLMLLEPMWFSTAWGVYNFAGMIQAALAAVIVVGLVLRGPGGPLRGIFNDDHLHDLGKLLLGFSCFWMYIWFSQYMLIWYSNIPEETAYYIPRMQGAWGPVTVLVIVLNWIVPFFVLLPRPSKRSGSIMMKVAVVVLIGRWADLYMIVFPAFREGFGATPVFGIWEIAAICCLIGSFGWLIHRAFFAAAAVPSGDPLLGESLHYHV